MSETFKLKIENNCVVIEFSNIRVKHNLMLDIDRLKYFAKNCRDLAWFRKQLTFNLEVFQIKEEIMKKIMYQIGNFVLSDTSFLEKFYFALMQLLKEKKIK